MLGNVEKQASERNATVVRKKDLEQIKRAERMKITRKPAKADQTIEDEEMTFGNFLRIIIIAGILIALFVLLGGQALQLSKSWE